MAQNPAIRPEPAWELCTETTSHAPLQTPFRELHSGKVDSPRGTNHSPNAPLLNKATLAFFSPSRLVSRGQRGSGLPLAPWALLLCSWSPELETHSERVLLRGEAGVGRKMPSGRRPQQSPRSQLESSATRPYLTLRSKLHAGSCIRESSTLLGEQTTAPMRLCIAKQRFPFSPLDLWTPYAKESLGCLWLPGPCCFAGGLLSWNATPNMLSFMAKQEFAEKCLLVAGPSNPPGTS